MQTNSESKLYQKAGVDADKADGLVSWLQEKRSTHAQSSRGRVVDGIGGFASLYQPNLQGMKEPLLVSSTDGVGTKVLLALESGVNLSGLGIDLVAMCVNDLYTVGAKPLFFLDYFATGQLNEQQFKEVLSGIHSGVELSGAVLLGGETAEMPGLYQKDHFDLAGFVVGIVERSEMLGKERVKEGDKLIGLASNGFHSNGFSLIRKWVDRSTDQKTLSNLLRPTKIYHELPDLAKAVGPDLHALAHITGGGIPGNLPRVIPDHLCCHVDWASIPSPAWMLDFIQNQGVNPRDTLDVFNLGLGMIAVVSNKAADSFGAAAQELSLTAMQIGEIKGKQQTDQDVIFH